MARSPATLLRLLTPLAVFAAVLTMLALLNRGGGAPPAPSPPAGVLGGDLSGRSAGDRTPQLQAAIRANPGDGRAYAALGDAYLQRARTTGDPAYYSRAGHAFDAGLRRDPTDVEGLIGAGTLANLRHDFGAGLRLARAAHRAAPELVQPYTVMADAQIELGRYDAAAASIQRLVDLKPGLPAYARVSYFRELSGDRRGALEAMSLAASAGGTADGVAAIQVLLGDLELAGGRLGAARYAYRSALAASPGWPQALAGLARVAVLGGDLDRAAALLRRSTDRLPLTTNLTLLADVEQAAGRRAAAAADLAAVRAQRQLLRAAGAVPDAETVLFEADHGSPAAAVTLGRGVWRAAPSVRSADALGWALTRASRPEAGLRWARRALRLGSRDPLFRFHAGIAARAAGRADLARRDLWIAEVGRGMLSPLAAHRLQEALR